MAEGGARSWLQQYRLAERDGARSALASRAELSALTFDFRFRVRPPESFEHLRHMYLPFSLAYNVT
jgi:hypothetical protein